MARRSTQLALDELPMEWRLDDLEGVEAELGVRLPAAVRAFFMAEQGRVRRRLPELTTDCARLRLYREAAECLLRDSGAEFRLARSDLVFLAPHDYQFFFFSCGGGDDPPVHRFVEGERQPRQAAASFTEWAAGLR